MENIGWFNCPNCGCGVRLSLEQIESARPAHGLAQGKDGSGVAMGDPAYSEAYESHLADAKRRTDLGSGGTFGDDSPHARIGLWKAQPRLSGEGGEYLVMAPTVDGMVKRAMRKGSIDHD